MSSDSSDVDSGFHFIWNIENIDICFYEQRITSPTFVAANLNHTDWCMSLHPLIENNTFNLALTRTDSGNATQSISIDFAISVSTSDGVKKVLKEKKAEFQTGSSNTCYWHYGSLQVLYGNDLTVFCSMQQKETTSCIHCIARTVIGKEERCGVWKVKSFRYLSPGVQKKFTLCSTSKHSPYIEISGILSKKSRFFHIELQVTYNNPIFILGKISLLTASGELKWSTKAGFKFENSTSSQTYKFPLIINQKYLTQGFSSRYLLPEGVLTLLCEFDVATGMKYSEIIESNSLTQYYRELMHREIWRNKSDELILDTEDEDTDKTQQISVNSDANSSNPQTLKEDLKKFYKQRKHCDITLNAENKSFPVHKSILCSRSSVFSSMFDHDMKETTNNKVEIVDIDADTLDRFLLFLYSDTLEDLQWNRATKLLYAANKYQVESLMKECSSFLVSLLSLSNVCDALVLADLYQDNQLRTECQNFIFDNASEIFSSTEWELFTVNNPLLSATMLKRYFLLKK